MDVETIRDGDQVVAIIVSGRATLSGNNFFTKDSDPLQFGVNLYEKGYESLPHVHIMKETLINNPQEMLHIDSGKLELTLFTERGKHLCSRVLSDGDSVFFAGGGHGVKIIEPTKIIEAKLGPYEGVDRDKRLINI